MIRILRMTATFGKLQNETLSFDPAFHIQQADNEWGKTTWCAFLEAMLYGVPTKGGRAEGEMAVRDRYKPWSGLPMAGVLELEKDGKGITVQRSCAGRGMLNQIRAYETESGVELPEYCTDNLGEALLGISREIFQRTCFLRECRLPEKSNDKGNEALVARLSELFATGDESGQQELLTRKLRELKNKCRSNNANGLIPDTEKQRQELQRQLTEIIDLDREITEYEAAKKQLISQEERLNIRLQWLAYNKATERAQALEKAEKELADAQAEAERLQLTVTADDTRLNTQEAQLQMLIDRQNDCRKKAEEATQLPPAPEASAVFQGLTPARAAEDARADFARLQALEKKRRAPALWIAGGLAALAGIGLLFVQLYGAIGCFAVAAVLMLLGLTGANRCGTDIAVLKEKYRNLNSEAWVSSAEEYGRKQEAYEAALTACRQAAADAREALEQVGTEIAQLTGGIAPGQFFEGIAKQRRMNTALAQAKQSVETAKIKVSFLQKEGKTVEKPEAEDSLDCSEEQASADLARVQAQLRQADTTLATCRGQRSHYGTTQEVETQLRRTEARLNELTKTYNALLLATELAAKAGEELQRRFAPQIRTQTQALFGRLTHGRYDRLTLDKGLNVQASATEETDLKNIQTRSDGTVDQLYLALRLAVAEQLAPEVPMILDDALIRFDDTRLQKALTVLKEQPRQIILFTCQSRENALTEKE